ncbi:MAG: hypothetical protein AAF829_07030 [Pseudomonadota bacterium]
MFNHEIDRFDRVAFADVSRIQRGGLFTQTPQALFVGFYSNRPLW